MIKSGMIIKAEEKVQLKRGNKVIERTLIDYQNNESHYKMRGFELYNSTKTSTKQPKKNVKKTKKNSK